MASRGVPEVGLLDAAAAQLAVETASELPDAVSLGLTHAREPTDLPAEVGQPLGGRRHGSTAGESSDSTIVERDDRCGDRRGMVGDVAEDPDRHPPVEPGERRVAQERVLRPQRWATAAAKLLDRAATASVTGAVAQNRRPRQALGGQLQPEAGVEVERVGGEPAATARSSTEPPRECPTTRSRPVGSVSTRSSANASTV